MATICSSDSRSTCRGAARRSGTPFSCGAAAGAAGAAAAAAASVARCIDWPMLARVPTRSTRYLRNSAVRMLMLLLACSPVEVDDDDDDDDLTDANTSFIASWIRVAEIDGDGDGDDAAALSASTASIGAARIGTTTTLSPSAAPTAPHAADPSSFLPRSNTCTPAPPPRPRRDTVDDTVSSSPTLAVWGPVAPVTQNLTATIFFTISQAERTKRRRRVCCVLEPCLRSPPSRKEKKETPLTGKKKKKCVPGVERSTIRATGPSNWARWDSNPKPFDRNFTSLWRNLNSILFGLFPKARVVAFFFGRALLLLSSPQGVQTTYYCMFRF